jgi:hypothetical protein
MNGPMNNRKNNVLPFPKPPEEPGGSTIICQVGSQRFALHMWVENLPPAPPPVGDAEAKGEEGAIQGYENSRGK